MALYQQQLLGNVQIAMLDLTRLWRGHGGAMTPREFLGPEESLKRPGDEESAMIYSHTQEAGMQGKGPGK